MLGVQDFIPIVVVKGTTGTIVHFRCKFTANKATSFESQLFILIDFLYCSYESCPNMDSRIGTED
jgi:hypothetical protein